MPIPDFQAIMLPLLRLAADGKSHTMAEAVEMLGTAFGLSDVDRKELLPSGRQFRFNNRVGWAKTYLKKTGLLSDSARGQFQITERGQGVLREKPAAIDLKFLARFPELDEFRSRKENNGTDESKPALPPSANDATPEEQLELSYLALRQKLADELIDRIKTSTPAFFERLVVELLVAMGYGGSLQDAGQAVGQSGDGGVDGIIKEDRLGLDAIYIQAKRWENNVGRPVVQAFAGSLEGYRARKGVLITTSSFSKDAREYVTRIEKKIVLVDGPELAQLMIEHDVGVTPQQTYTTKKIDLDYFADGAEA